MIELINFGKRYGEFTAVENLNLKIEAGELFGFIGPKGAGKSTSLNLITTLLMHAPIALLPVKDAPAAADPDAMGSSIPAEGPLSVTAPSPSRGGAPTAWTTATDPTSRTAGSRRPPRG